MPGGGAIQAIGYAAVAIGVLFFLWRVYRAGQKSERLKSETKSREVEQSMTDEVTKRLDPGDTEKGLGGGKF